MPFLIDILNTGHPATAVAAALRFQMGTIRPVETQDALDNWSSVGSDQRGYTKHHQVPWFTLKSIFNRAMLDLRETQNDKLWNLIKKASYVGGNAGENQVPLAAAAKYLMETVIPLPLLMGHVADAQPVMPAPHFNAINHMASRFCWMPGNFFLGPTPQSRLDDPGNDSYDMPPMGKGGKLAMLLGELYKHGEAGSWAEVATALDGIFKEGVAKRGACINYDHTDWRMSILPGTAINKFKKRIA